MSVKQKLPDMKLLEQNIAGDGEAYLVGHAYEVCSWRPGPVGSGPCTEVHVIVPLGDGIKSVMRIKSARALDELVGVLLDYRKEVWP